MEEVEIRKKILCTPVPLRMTAMDWALYHEAQDYHVCDQPLWKENFLDSALV